MRENKTLTYKQKYIELNKRKIRKIKSKEFLPKRNRNKFFMDIEFDFIKDIPINTDNNYYKSNDY